MIEQICKWLLKKLGKDSRHYDWFWQRRKYGFDDRELWSLDITIAKFVLPRLKLLPINDSEMQSSVNKMIRAFELLLSKDGGPISKYENKEVSRGLYLFARYFRSLWY